MFKLPDPTKSREQRNAYIKYVLPFGIMSVLTSASTMYGFNVWLLPVSLSLYGSDATYSMRNSVVLISFSSQMILSALIMETMSAKLLRWPTHVVCAVNAFLYPLGLILSGVSIHYGTGATAEIGLFLSQFFVCGTALAIAWFSSQVKIVMWFREIGRPSVGAGVFGFFNGFWPMTFSYWGTALVKEHMHLSFFYAAVVIFVGSLPSVFLLRSPEEVPLMKPESADHSTSTNEMEAAAAQSHMKRGDSTPPESNSSESKTGLTEAASPLLPKAEFNRQPQAYIQSIVWFLTFIPGFSIKFTIAPIMSSVFGASVPVQVASSFIFLFFYAAARLLIGLIIGSRVKVNTVARTVTSIIPICIFFCGATVKAGKTYHAWMWGFVVANIFVACALGVEKVLMSLISLANWGVNNMKQMLARAALAISLAATTGPIIIWMGLSKPGDVFLDPRLNTSEQQQIELEQSMGTALLSLGGIGVLGFLGHWLCVKPYKPSSSN